MHGMSGLRFAERGTPTVFGHASFDFLGCTNMHVVCKLLCMHDAFVRTPLRGFRMPMVLGESGTGQNPELATVLVPPTVSSSASSP